MDLKDLMGHVVDSLYDGLTGGSAELPLPENVMINWLMPGLPFHESAFDFAIAGPFAGPTPQTMDYFRELVEMLMGGGQQDGEGQPGGQSGGQPGIPRDQAIEEAKRMYQQHLLGSWEQWSRLVDFIPLPNPTPEQNQWTSRSDQGANKHVSVVYGQAGQRLSDIYRDTLLRCEVANEQLSEHQKKIVERMRALLMEAVEVEDFLTGEMKTEYRESRAMVAYKDKRTAYENAVIDYASRLARAQNGTAEDLIAWQQSGGIYRERAAAAMRDWVANGYKNDIERAESTLNHILGGSMVQWKNELQQAVDQIDDNTQGVFGYPFFPASVLPGGFARSQGWSRFSELKMERNYQRTESRRSWRARGGLSLGLFSIGGSGGGSRREEEVKLESNTFGMEFDYTTVEIMRPAFNPNFFLSRGWRPRDEFVRDHGPRHSDGENPPSGAMIGYPTKALFVRNLVIHSRELTNHMKEKQEEVHGGAFVGYGPFVIGGRYRQSNKERETNFEFDGSSIRVKGLQLVGFMSALFPYTANPSPDVENWI